VPETSQACKIVIAQTPNGSDMVYCDQCGTRADRDTKYCRICGKKINHPSVLWRRKQNVVIGSIIMVMIVGALFLGGYYPGSQVTWLHTCGTEICDEQNQPVKLYGPNFVGGDGKGLGLADIQRIKALGFNTIRVMMPWGRLQPFGQGLNGTDVRYFTGIDDFPLYHGLDEVMNWTIRERMYLILTVWWSAKEPPPAWAFPNITDNNQRNSALILDGDASKARTGLMNLWKFIANRYRNIPNLVLELLNEPFVMPTAPNYSVAGSAYKTFNEDIISSIESVETRSHLKLVEPLIRGDLSEEIVDGAMDIDKTNVVWAFHYYAPITDWDPNGSYWHESFTWHGQYYPAGWNNGTIYVTWRITRVCDMIRAWKKPLMVTEFAKDTTQTYWKEWYQLVLSILSDYVPSGLILHQYASDPQYEAGWNINNPTTQEKLMAIRFW